MALGTSEITIRLLLVIVSLTNDSNAPHKLGHLHVVLDLLVHLAEGGEVGASWGGLGFGFEVLLKLGKQLFSGDA